MKKNKIYWDWLVQARINYNRIEKTSTCYPFIKCRIYNYTSNSSTKISNTHDLISYDTCENTITINFKKKNVKALYWEWFENVHIKFKHVDFLKTKIDLKNIFNSIQKDARWTKKQKFWIEEKNIPLPKLFVKPLNTITRIEDFRTKFLMNFWGKNKKKCLCGMTDKDFSSYHLLFECNIVKEWENSQSRTIRINNSFSYNSIHYNFSWIINWCIWKTYFQIIYNKKKFIPSVKFEYLIEENEYIHLKLISATLPKRSKKNKALFYDQIKYFKYYTLVDGDIYHKTIRYR